MIDSIVVPLDGSRLAETAIPTARWLARSAHGGLHLLHIRPGDEKPEAAEAYLGEAAATIGKGDGPATDYDVREGAVLEALQAAVCSRGANLVVMATRGQGDPGPLGRRSIAERLAACSATPILLVKHCPGSTPPGEPKAFRKIIAALDLERDPARSIAGLADFASLSQAHVTLLTVVSNDFAERGVRESRCRDALAHLDALADQLRALGARVAARVAVGSDVATTILAEAARGAADLIVLRPRSCPPQITELFGRTTDAVIRRATTPVLVLPPVAASA